MKTRIAIASTMACFLVLIGAFGRSADGGPIVPHGRYCLTYDVGGSDCSFTSYQQCLDTVSGIDAECYGKTAADDRNDQTQSGKRPASGPSSRGSLHMRAPPPFAP